MDQINALLFALSSAIIIVLVFVAFRLFIGRATRQWTKHKARTVDQWKAEEIPFELGPVGGQFGGLESTGINRVIRGIGLVVITDRDLRVTRSVPEGVWQINFRQIKGVTIQPTYLGHRGKTPFIVVRFTNEGELDKLGFQVKEVDTWAQALAKAAKVRVKDKREQ